MLSQLRPALVTIMLFTLLTGIIIPLGFVGIGQLALPFQANGSLITQNGKIIGSALIGQNFTSEKYVWGRPSALMGADPKDSTKQIPTPYDARQSGASNLGPTSKALLDRVTADIAKFPNKPVPADAVTTSASGLDPDISSAYAQLQLARVAKARGLPEAQVQKTLAASTEKPYFGFIGAPRINVLKLNMALDQLK